MVKIAGRWWGKAATAKQIVAPAVEDPTAGLNGSAVQDGNADRIQTGADVANLGNATLIQAHPVVTQPGKVKVIQAGGNEANALEAPKPGGLNGAGDFKKTVEGNKTANANQAGPDRLAGEKTVADKSAAEKVAVGMTGADRAGGEKTAPASGEKTGVNSAVLEREAVMMANRHGMGTSGPATSASPTSGSGSATAGSTISRSGPGTSGQPISGSPSATAGSPISGSGTSAAAATTAGMAGATGKTGVGAPVLAHDKRRALGRGLESLLPGPRPVGGPPAVAPETGASAAVTEGATAVAPVPGVIAELHAQAARKAVDEHNVVDLGIDQIDVNPHQTRSFTQREKDTLEALAASIKVQGVIQPITVRPGKGGKYVLITGERRMRASTMAGKTTIPAIVRVVSEQQAAEMTVIENLQRQDLTCIDLARAYVMLSKDFGLTQEQIGERVGSSRESVSNYMRLVKLPDLVQHFLGEGQLEFSHARLLLNLRDPDTIRKMAHNVVMNQISVDKLEDLVYDHNYPVEGQAKPVRRARWVDPNVKAAQRKMEEVLGVRVKIRDRNNKGKITLEYGSLEDFDRVVGMLTGKS